jgi:hypothetical protein
MLEAVRFWNTEPEPPMAAELVGVAVGIATPGAPGGATVGPILFPVV